MQRGLSSSAGRKVKRMEKKFSGGMLGFSSDNEQTVYISFRNYQSRVNFLKDDGLGNMFPEASLSMFELTRLLKLYHYIVDNGLDEEYLDPRGVRGERK